MTINLEEFVNKEVIIRFYNGSRIGAIIEKDNLVEGYPFYFKDEICEYQYYSKSGYAWKSHRYCNIIDIQLKKPQKTMALSDKTIEKLAEALAPEAVEYIQQSDEYLQFMTEQLTKFLKERMGEMDNEVAVEIVSIIFADNTNLCARKPV